MTLKNSSFSIPNQTRSCIDDGNFESTQGIILIVKIVAFITIYTVSTVGNLIIAYVIVRTHRLWTFTNIMMLNYSIVTLLFLASGLLQFITDIIYRESWPFGEFLCKITYSSFVVTVVVSAFSITFMCYARYRVICLPLNIQPNRRQALYSIIFSWVVAIACMIPYAIVLKITRYGKNDYCVIDSSWGNGGHRPVYDFSIFAITYFMPMLVATYYNIRVIKGLKIGRSYRSKSHHKLSGNSYYQPDESIDQVKEKLRQMSVFIFTAYLIAWLPYWIYVLLINTKILNAIILQVKKFDCHIISKVLIVRTFTKYIAYFYSTSNVFVCYYYNPHFNAAFKSIFCCKRCTKGSDCSFDQDQRFCSIYKCSYRSDTPIYSSRGCNEDRLVHSRKSSSHSSITQQITSV
ncbi:Neuropeptide FF receptor 2 [Trichoplax sp. H2]|nr:Neuropeptide FF receptor 2 [Trichoplax sp. H2]|eukprot:RDD38452.1 Neuropeptide FF receptor 2 [Trichoplax sp. H2]